MAPHRQRGPRGAEKGVVVVETLSPTLCRWMLLRQRKPQAIKGMAGGWQDASPHYMGKYTSNLSVDSNHLSFISGSNAQTSAPSSSSSSTPSAGVPPSPRGTLRRMLAKTSAHAANREQVRR